MKRLIMLLVLPFLGSCTIEDDYYNNDYRRPPPRAQVEVPSYHSSNQYRHHRDVVAGNPRVDIATVAHSDSRSNTKTYGNDTRSQDYAGNNGNRNHGHD